MVDEEKWFWRLPIQLPLEPLNLITIDPTLSRVSVGRIQQDETLPSKRFDVIGWTDFFLKARFNALSEGRLGAGYVVTAGGNPDRYAETFEGVERVFPL